MRDVLGTGLKVLFVGFNPSPRSAEIGHHYAGRNNQFWFLLYEAGLTPRLLQAEEDGLLPQWGIGSTNLTARPTRGVDDLSAGELRSGVPKLRGLVESTATRLVAYTGKGVYLAAVGKVRAPWGLQETRAFEPALDFVLSSPSGRVRMLFEEKLTYYRQLADLLDHACPLPQ